MTISSVAVVMTDAGPVAPTYFEIVEYLKSENRKIYGEDIYLENDSQDGQWIGVIAKAIADCNSSAIKAYSTMSPKTATKEALARNVALNGIKPSPATYSTVDVVITGVAGTSITNANVSDTSNNIWVLPVSITIPPEGAIVVTATAEKAGAVIAMPNTVSIIGKPTRGWHGVSNPNSSSVGQDAESDTKLRQRQSLSTANASMSQLEGLRGAILALNGVTRCVTFENKSSLTDENNLPAKSACVVVHGGDSHQIAKLMHIKKSMGCDWHGNTDVTVLNVYNEPEVVSIYRADVTNISFKISITTKESYSADTGDIIKNLLAEYTNALNIGDKITQNKITGVTNLYGAEQSQTYEVVSIKTIANGIEHAGDYTLPFGNVAFCDATTITIEVTGG